MSVGCGTLAGPTGFRTGNLAASSSNGKQHSLPKNPGHESIRVATIKDFWASANQTKGPNRLWGQTQASRYGGEERIDSSPDYWRTGEFWNVDSNITIWGRHEVRRNAAEASHDVHRHEQIRRMVIPPQPHDPKQESKICYSGVISPDSCFLEAWGFDLGLRDRQGDPAPLWHPPSKNQMFRAPRSYDRNIPRLLAHTKTLLRRESLSNESTLSKSGQVDTLLLEDIAGETEHDKDHEQLLATQGKPFASRSCHYWDDWGHTTKREAARMARSIHTNSGLSHPQGFPFKDNCEVNPASVYTLKYRKMGEESLRKHFTASQKAQRSSSVPAPSKTLSSSALL